MNESGTLALWRRDICVGVLILVAAIYSLVAPNLSHEVSQYKLNDDITYDGTMKGAKFSGAGVVTNQAGDILQGDFKDGLPYGPITFLSHEGWVVAGVFRQGMPVGEVTLLTENGRMYRRQAQSSYQLLETQPSPGLVPGAAPVFAPGTAPKAAPSQAPSPVLENGLETAPATPPNPSQSPAPTDAP